MPGKSFLKWVFWFCILSALLSVGLIAFVDRPTSCFSSSCFDYFLNIYKFPLGLGGLSVAVWTLELGTRRAEQTSRALFLDAHYRRMDYFSNALSGQLEGKTLKNFVNGKRFYNWLYPQSLEGSYDFNEYFVQLNSAVASAALSVASFIESFTQSEQFPYVGPISPLFMSDLHLNLPPRCGVEIPKKLPSDALRHFGEGKLAAIIEELELYVNLVQSVNAVDELRRSDVYIKQISTLQASMRQLNEARNEMNRLESQLLIKANKIGETARELKDGPGEIRWQTLADKLIKLQASDHLSDYAMVRIVENIASYAGFKTDEPAKLVATLPEGVRSVFHIIHGPKN